jgi:hypothetical protein
MSGSTWRGCLRSTGQTSQLPRIACADPGGHWSNPLGYFIRTPRQRVP